MIDQAVLVGPASAAARRPRSGLLRRAMRKPLGVISAAYLVLVTIACVAAPLLAPYGALDQDLSQVRAGPSARHLLGTDALGRDVLSRLLFGGRITLLGVAEAVAVLLVVSVPLGVLAGYLSGWFDRIVTGVVDLVLSLPAIIIVLAVLAVFGSSMSAAMITFGVLGSAGLVRVLRGVVLAIREEPYVAAAQVCGCTMPQLLWRHILPGARGPLVVQTALFAGVALVIQTGLAFLELGIDPPAPSWGGMVGDAAEIYEQDPWLLVPSGAVIALTILAFGLIGDTIRDASTERRARSGSAANWAQATRAQRPSHTSDDAPATPALLSVAALSVQFDAGDTATTVLHEVSLELGRGEILGIVGESGSGKTVSALAMLGLLPPGGSVTSGRIALDGHDLTGLNERELGAVRGSEIAMISQEPMAALDPSFRVVDQIAEVVRRHEHTSRRQSRDRAMELLGRVRLPRPDEVGRRYPHELSGGMAQRVCIALALAGSPRVLVADEPTTALDVTVQAGILELLRTIRDETGMSIVLVTHDWGVVADICDRATVMYAGEVVESAPTTVLFAGPRHPYTMGLLECDPALSVGAETMPAIPGTVPQPGSWPRGCHFQDRCRFAVTDCRRDPVPLEHEGGRDVRCIRWQALDRGVVAR